MIELHPNLDLTTAQAEAVLQEWLGESVTCSGIQPLTGGMVNTVLKLEFDRAPHRAVVKLHGGDDPFAKESSALRFLRAETDCPVPEVFLDDRSRELIPHAFLLLEHITGDCLKDLDLTPSMRADIDVQLADVLAELHTHQRRTFGAIADESDERTWAELFLDRLDTWRSHPEVEGRLLAGELSAVDQAIEAVPTLLRDAEAPTLVHGDVWDGNLMVDRVNGHWRLTGLLDPDLQFADVDLELAYIEVFNNRRDAFFAAYTEGRPLRDGYEQRRLFYWLRTALLHVGLFEDQFFREFTARTAERITRLQA